MDGENAVITRGGRHACSARRWNSGIARSAWTSAKPAPTPAFIASSAPAASSGNCAAKKPGSGVREMKNHKDTKVIKIFILVAKYLPPKNNFLGVSWCSWCLGGDLDLLN
jgi:hypothetical protein